MVNLIVQLSSFSCQQFSFCFPIEELIYLESFCLYLSTLVRTKIIYLSQGFRFDVVQSGAPPPELLDVMSPLSVLVQLEGFLKLLIAVPTGEKPGHSADDGVGASLFKLTSLLLDISPAEFLLVATENASSAVCLQTVRAFFTRMSSQTHR